MDVFEKSEELKQGIYILNRNDVAGVVLSKEVYEGLLSQIEELEEKTCEAEVARRIAIQNSQENPVTFTVEEVMGEELANTKYDPDEADGWE